MASSSSGLPFLSRTNTNASHVGSIQGAPGTVAAATAANSSSAAYNRRTSLSSFPASRSSSQMSQTSRPSKSPAPPPTYPPEADRTSNPSSKSKTSSTRTGVSSQHSSLSAPRQYNPNAHPPRRLRSQYPRGATENHVEYILVASFDIDRGPVMEHQFPVAITGDEHMLAELMLPDQAHARNQDWTIFFLHKDTSQEEEDEERRLKDERRRRRRRRRDRAAGIIDEEDEDDNEYDDEDDLEDDEWDYDDDTSEDEPEGGVGPPLIYVLNLVNTKHDKTVKRGAVVKAMAICTRHPFLHIYKPLLLLALEEYFKSPVTETLSMLYDAVNAMDLSLMPKLSILERQLLQASDNKDLFVDKFEQMIQLRIAEERGRDTSTSQHALDASQDPVPPKSSQGQQHLRPGISRAGTKAHFEGHSTYAVPRDTHEFESKVMYKGIPIPIKVPVAVLPETVGDFSLIKLIQTFSEPHAKSPIPFPNHGHLTTNGPSTHPIIVLVNAMLTQKRVIFLGHNMPSGEVAEAVLGACALASGGILRGFTRHAFPYTDLTKIDDLLNVPGFIAGVTNPTFELHPEWWDILCDLQSGRIRISAKIENAAVTEGFVYFQQQNPAFAGLVNGSSSIGGSGVAGAPASSTAGGAAGTDLTGDSAFVGEILKSIAARHGERVIRAKWRDWIVRFTRIAAAFEESVYGASALYIGSDDFDVGIAAAAAAASSSGGSGSVGSGGGGAATGHGFVWADENAKNRELAGNVMRIEGWRNTRSYYSYIQDLAQFYTLRPLKGLDLHHLHDRLRTQRLTPLQSREIYLAFSRFVHSYDEICLLLSVAPESHAGLFYLALGLFHKEREVRVRTAELLQRIAEHEGGRHWWKGLSRFERLAFVRIRREVMGERGEEHQQGKGDAAGGVVVGGAR